MSGTVPSTDPWWPAPPSDDHHGGQRHLVGPRRAAAGDLEVEVVNALVAEVHRGSDEAWEMLYHHAYPKLYAYARRRLPGPEHAGDAVAETMARAIAGIATWAGEGGGFLAWLYGILRHVVADAQRVSWREHPAAAADVSGSTSEPTSASEPHERLVHREELDHLRSAFSRLAPEEREVLELRVVDGLGADEVASVLGRRPGAVRMAQSRALAHLRLLVDAPVARRARRRLPARSTDRRSDQERLHDPAQSPLATSARRRAGTGATTAEIVDRVR
ncbi:MAG: RNA polymerase sigma factor [Acidimicrobiales bacterium]